MDIEKWDPFKELASLRNFARFPSVFQSLFDLEPATDLSEDGTSVHLKMQIPGFAKHQISVDLNGDILTVKGEMIEEVETDKKYYRKEIKTSSFCRSFSLPAKVDPDKIKATFENGILQIVMEKQTQEKTKKIEIK